MKLPPNNGTGRQNHSDDEDEPVVIPPFDSSALIARLRLILIGRIFHTGGRSTDALLAFMPRSGIWDVAGRVRGVDLGNGCFHFDFETEEDLLKVLKKRPCHFNKWNFALERWEPNIRVRDDFPSCVTFWITIRGIPLHLWVEDVLRRIGNALGMVKEVDVNDGRVSVAIDVTKPLKFKKKVLFNSSEEITVTLEYERLYRFCSICNMISHEAHACPTLPAAERRRSSETRQIPPPRDSRRFRASQPEGNLSLTNPNLAVRPSRSGRGSSQLEGSVRVNENSSSLPEKEAPIPSRSLSHRPVRRSLYHGDERIRQEEARGSVWKRLSGDRTSHIPRHREQSSHSSAGSRKRWPHESASSHELWREIQRTESNRGSSQRQEKAASVQRRNRSSPRNDLSFDQWGNSRPPRHQNGITIREPSSPAPPAEKAADPLDKGKGKAVMEEEEDANSDAGDFESSPKLLEVGSASGAIHSPPFGEIIPALEELHQKPVFGCENVTDEARSMFGTDSVPTDWEDRADGMEEDIVLTEEDLRILDECERMMMTEEAMDEDDLLGEDHAAGESAVSLERTISEVAVPVTHSSVVASVFSQSPTSKRTRSPDHHHSRKSQKSSPHIPKEKPSQKKKISKSPKVSAAASKKLKPFQNKSPPKKRSGMTSGKQEVGRFGGF
ncbi:uncharacterized protein LOC18011114 [Eutrema salsugineum]|uniref:uncharacterized protein LOC18011114 n=1 Tax=Eutrema salsugineum TaxID=72664 RepID=UPI000CED659A|nr:uncharacterized protein LOC18011114 [Eutrema salsugineum]